MSSVRSPGKQKGVPGGVWSAREPGAWWPTPPQSHLAAGGLSCLLGCKPNTIEKAPLSVEASPARSAPRAQPGLCKEARQHQIGERSLGTRVGGDLTKPICRGPGQGGGRSHLMAWPGPRHCLHLDALCFVTVSCLWDRSHSLKPAVHTISCPAFLLITQKPLSIIICSFRTYHFGHANVPLGG